MTDDSTPEDRDRDRNHDGSGDEDASRTGDANILDDGPVDADPEPNGAGSESADRAVPDGTTPDGTTPDDTTPDPVVRDVAPDPSPDARPRGDAPEPPADDVPNASNDGGPIPTEVDVENVFEPQNRTPEAEPADTPDERIIPKRTYCERCEYFERPPAVGCTHEGTEILEMVDRREFRVVNCPVVAEREALADEDGDGREPELEDDEHWRGDVGPN